MKRITINLRRAVRSVVESLELRRMFAASVTLDPQHGTMTLTGTPGNDHLEFWCADWGQRLIEYQANAVSGGLYSGTAPYYYNTINIYGVGGNDTIDLPECPIGININIFSGGAGSDTINVGPGPSSSESGNVAQIHFYGAGGNSTLNYQLPGYPVKDTLEATVASDRITLGGYTTKQGIFFQGVNIINVSGSDNPYGIHVMSVAANQTTSIIGDHSYYWIGRPAYASYTYDVGNSDIAANIRGNLFIDGGQGANDKVIFNDSSSGGNIDTLSYNTFATFTIKNAIQFANVEQLTIFGSQDNDVINVTSGSGAKAININAAGGNDVIRIGGYGLDPVMSTAFNVDGFTGNDTLIANDAQHFGPTSYVIASGKFQRDANAKWNFAGLEQFDLSTAWGNDYVNGSAANVPLVINGSAGSDTVYGSAFGDVIRGGAGNDYLFGLAGNDVIDGGTGGDTISGGAGADTADYSSRTNAVTVGLNNAGGDGEANEHDDVHPDIEVIVGGSGNDHLYLNFNGAGTLYGNGGNDTLVGSNYGDVLWGGAGDDSIKAGGGNDTLYGGDGADRLAGGDGNDTVYSSDASKDSLDGGAGTNTLYKDNLDVISVGL
jgi:Ca2+-binding RTX toxin-like protein